MKLEKKEVELFYKLFHSLFVYVNKKFKILPGLNSREDIRNFPLEEINKIREKLYKEKGLFESFVKENPFKFSKDELEIIDSWKHFVKGEFFIFRYLKNYTIFLDYEHPPKCYGVLGINDEIENLVGPHLPIMINTVLLPFKGKIIYDSIFSGYPFSFGSGLRGGLNEAYQEAKSKQGIITSLPFSLDETENDMAQLKFYLSSKSRRENYQDEVEDLIEEDSKLLKFYHQEMGKIHARSYKRTLKDIGFKDCWFSILKGVIVASGKTKKQLEKNLKDILPSGEKDFCYIFQLEK